MPKKRQEANASSSASDGDLEEPRMDIKSILKEIEFFGSSHMTWKQKDLENRRAVSRGGKLPEQQRLPLSVERVTMKKQKEGQEKLHQDNAILRRFGGYNSSGANKAEERCRPEDRLLRSTEGRFRNGVVDVKHLLQPSAPQVTDDNSRQATNKGKKKKSGEKGHSERNGGGKKQH